MMLRNAATTEDIGATFGIWGSFVIRHSSFVIPARVNRHDQFAPRRADFGFTLAELLTVIAIIALVGGLGAGAFQRARRSYSLSASAGRIQGVIRAARNSALTTGGAAFVVIDPARKTVAAHVFDPVGEWTFDGDGAGGLARERQDGGAAVGAVPGRIGRAFDARTGGAYVNAGSEARFDLRTSIFIGAWVQHSGFGEVKELPRERDKRGQRASGGARTSSRGRRSLAATRQRSETRARARRRLEAGDASARGGVAGAIVSKKGAYFLGMTPGGVLEAAIGDYRVRTLDPVVPPGRWVHVTLRYDGLDFELSADGVPRPWQVVGRSSSRSSSASASSSRPSSAGASSSGSSSASSSRLDRGRLPPVAPVTTTPVTISSSAAPFPGLIDEVQLAGAAEPLVYRYAEFEHILGWKRVIRFSRQGRLDRLRHDGPVRIVLVELPDDTDGSSGTEAAVDYSVTFAQWRAQWESPPDDLTEAGEEAKLERRFRSDGRIAITVEPLGAVTAARLEDGP